MAGVFTFGLALGIAGGVTFCESRSWRKEPKWHWIRWRKPVHLIAFFGLGIVKADHTSPQTA
jgi:hypothetical protein